MHWDALSGQDPETQKGSLTKTLPRSYSRGKTLLLTLLPMNSGHFFSLYQVLPKIFFVFLHFLKQEGSFTIVIYIVQHLEN